jgi:hypothetical protein
MDKFGWVGRVFGWIRGVGPAINSPIFITVIGGVLIAAITNKWQENAERQASMEKCMVQFADQYAKLLDAVPILKTQESRADSLHLKVEALEADAKSDEGDIRRAQLLLSAADSEYEKTVAKIESLEDPTALTSEAEAIFSSHRVYVDMTGLGELTYTMETTGDTQLALEDRVKALGLYQKSLQDMVSEIRK